MRSEITAGQTSDYLGFDLVIADNLPEPSVPLADRGYDADSIREKMNARDAQTQIPMRKSRKMRVGADHSLYALRNLVERCFDDPRSGRGGSGEMSEADFTLPGRNPDVLSCIANLSNDEVFTPPDFANRMLDTLADAWARQWWRKPLGQSRYALP